MTHPFLPPRGIFVPTQMIFNTQLPSAVLVTWIQLRCLAWSGWVTPPLCISELAAIIGIHPARLHRHLSQLQDISALSWRTTRDGKLILSFPEDQTIKTENQAVTPIDPSSVILNSQNPKALDPPSYFPAHILGYLSFQEDQDGFSDHEFSNDLEDERAQEVSSLVDFQNFDIDQHAKKYTQF
jgi:hypothetical protein